MRLKSALKSTLKSILPAPKSSPLAKILYKGCAFLTLKRMSKAELEDDRASYIAQNADPKVCH